MPVLRGEPDLFDVEAWKQRLADLRADPQDATRDIMIGHCLAHLAAITSTPEKTPTQGH